MIWIDLLPLIGMLGSVSLLIMLLVLGLLSRRLGSVTRTKPYYIWFFVGAALLGISGLLQMLNAGGHIQISGENEREIVRLIIYTGLPALGVTVGVVVAWRYWSWLLAERS